MQKKETGIRDKNGRMLYEGDRIKYRQPSYPPGYRDGFIVWSDKDEEFMITNTLWMTLFDGAGFFLDSPWNEIIFDEEATKLVNN